MSARVLRATVRSFLVTGTAGDRWLDQLSTRETLQVEGALRSAVERALVRRIPTAQRALLPAEDAAAHVASAIRPLVHGLFAPGERRAVHAFLRARIHVVHDGNIMALLRDTPSPHVAWKLANLYLAARGARALGRADHAAAFQGHGHAYVPAGSWVVGGAHLVVHEAAHLLHVCTRAAAGLSTRRRQRLVRIPWARREVFAYACELLWERKAHPHAGVAWLARSLLAGTGADTAEVVRVVHEAGLGPGAWKRLAASCGDR